ncbi:hypothetical protein HDU96_005466 [Phlyctochytrium bullatum]|nr:hypothetical protein HDU96_005466 [Phlyctochytrium bullatum]
MVVSRYDQSTYWGRLKHFAEVTDPRNLFASNTKLENAKALVESYKRGEAVKATEEQLWAAKKHAYCTAVASSCTIALGLNSAVQRFRNLSPMALSLMQKAVPFTAVAAAGTLNVFLMRQKELTDGIAVQSKDGTVVGKSKVAGWDAVGQVAISRVATAFPAVFLPGIIMSQVEKSSLLKTRPYLSMPLNLAVICGSLMAALPCAVAIFPQVASTSVDRLEPELRNLVDADGKPIQTTTPSAPGTSLKPQNIVAETPLSHNDSRLSSATRRLMDRTPVMNLSLDRFRHVDLEHSVEPNEPRMKEKRKISRTGSGGLFQEQLKRAKDDDDDAMDQSWNSKPQNRDNILAEMLDMYPDIDVRTLDSVLHEKNFDKAMTSEALADMGLIPPVKRRKLVRKSEMPPSPPASKPGPKAGSNYAKASSSNTVYSVPRTDPHSKASKAAMRKTAEDESEPEFNHDDEDDDDESDANDMDNDDSEAFLDVKTLSFVNEATEEALVEVGQCTPEQARLIRSFLPFEIYEDLIACLESQKKGKALVRIIERCRETLSGYDEVDNLIEVVEKRGQEILGELRKWKKKSAASSAQPKDDEEGEMHLTGLEIRSQGERSRESSPPSTELLLTSQPALINKNMTLKSYQLIGISWLHLLYTRGLGAILADEMGLGKTAQVIKNWIREVEKWCPSLEAVAYYGSQAERAELREEIYENNPDIVVTTYNVATGQKEDKSFLRKHGFSTMILDEGHMVKNRLSARYKALDSIESLLSFILPEVFRDNEEALKRIFTTKGLVNSSQTSSVLSDQRISRARKMMTPFVLRRKKADVLKELPQKVRSVEMVKPTPAQEALYEEIVSQCKKAYASDKDEASDTTSKTNASTSIMSLRKAANHPLLFRRHYPMDKLKVIARDIIKEPEYRDSNYDYVVEDLEVMSDFEIDTLVRKYKRLQKYTLDDSLVMDAGKVQRLKVLLPELIEKAIIDEYNTTPSISVFLLSTKACGLGLNLTSANVVILHDIDFNPHNDAQAEDRAHRVGQEQDVYVYKMILDNSIEQHMLNLASAKLTLDKQMHVQDDELAGKDEEDGMANEAEETQLSGEFARNFFKKMRAEWEKK